MPATAQLERYREATLEQLQKLADKWGALGEEPHPPVSYGEACDLRELAYAEAAMLLNTFADAAHNLITREKEKALILDGEVAVLNWHVEACECSQEDLQARHAAPTPIEGVIFSSMTAR
jgi:hypothetical protein|tara:strand:+ start:1307 stop:1666 length:360 start_codon:yes stop_codon:yes gene_type:complete